jgi:lipopolysaccharide transport system permease protein
MTETTLEETIIRPIQGAEAIKIREVWRYRNLLYSLAVKDIRVKYDALHLGFMWPLVRPLLITIIVSLFKNATSAETGEKLPYLLFVYAGVLFWFYFAETLIEVAGGLQRDAALLMKVYYPRIISPLVSLFSSLFELGIALLPLVLIMLIYGVGPGLSLLLLPLVFLQLMLFTLGCGLILSYLSLHVRDFQLAVGLVLYIGIFVSPVFHNVDILPPSLTTLSRLNPMLGTLNAVRCTLFDLPGFPWAQWGISCGVTLLILCIGVALFKRLQHKVVEML